MNPSIFRQSVALHRRPSAFPLLFAASLLLPLASVPQAAAQDGTWINKSGGSWASTSNWANGVIPTGFYSAAFFDSLDLTANATVSLNGNRTVGRLVFGDLAPSHNWTLAPGTTSTLTLDYPAEVEVVNQTVTFTVPLAGYNTFSKTGPGTLVLNAASTTSGSLQITEGTAQLAYNSGSTGTLRGAITIQPAGTLITSAPNALGYSGTNWVRSISINGGTFHNTAANADQGWGVSYYLTGGTLRSSGTGSRIAAGGGSSVTTYASDAPSLISGEFRLRENNTNDRLVFNIADGSADPDLRVDGPITTNASTRGIEKSGLGLMEITSNCTYTGPTQVNQGTLRIAGTLAATTVTVAAGSSYSSPGTLTGTGTINGPTTINGIIAPGNNGIGTLRIANTLRLASSTQMEIRKSGGVTSCDAIQGITTLTHGGNLVVALVNGSEPLAAGDSFPLFSATTRTGTFAATDLPILPTPLRWDTSLLYSQGRISVATGPQTIHFSAPADLAVGDPSATLNATASSGLPVTFTSSNPAVATIDGSTLTPVSPGIVVLTASQAGNALWSAATPVVHTIRIWPKEKSPQEIEFLPPANPVYGGAPVALEAAATSGLPVIFTSSDPAIARIENDHIVALFPGTATITASQPGNVEFAPAPPLSYEITISPGELILPQSVHRSAALGSARITVDVPVASTSGTPISWSASFSGFPAWVRLVTTSGGTPGTLRIEFDPASGIAPGTQQTTLTVHTAGAAYPLPLSLTVESATPFETFHFATANTIPIRTDGFDASGKNAFISLGFTPLPGTRLTLIDNTGSQPITSTFLNLAHGRVIQLPFNGISYPFVANYYGGSGNDLVLQWANNRLVASGAGTNGQLGNGSSNNSLLPTPVDTSGVLAGKTIMATSTGGQHTLALCSDGTLAAWGYNYSGQIGDASYTNRPSPVLVSRSGVLKDKSVTHISAGLSFSLALCADGTLAAWGYNDYNQLGIGSSSPYSTSEPRLVDRSGVLAGKTITQLAAGGHFAMALCSDGTLVTWGNNTNGELGNGSASGSSSVPVTVDQTSVLAGKTIVQIAASNNAAMVLCSDGTLATWGSNYYGQLGNATYTSSNRPVLVSRGTTLAGKTISRIATGQQHHLALCTDGTLATWGYNSSGQLGNGTTTDSNIPVAVNRTGALAGKTIIQFSGGLNHSVVTCSDGTICAWGANSYGEFGNNSNNSSSTPVAVSPAGAATDGRFTSASAGWAGSFTLATAALPPAASATTLPATAILDTGATLNAAVNASGSETTVAFEYGLTSSYGNRIAAQPATTSGIATLAATAPLTNLIPETTYHYRVTATSAGGTVYGANGSFTTTGIASLAALSTDHGTLAPAFHPSRHSYEVLVPSTVTAIRLTASPRQTAASLTIDGSPADAGTPCPPIPLASDQQTIPVNVNGADGINARTYTVRVIRLPETLTFQSATTVPITVEQLQPSGLDVRIALGFAPIAGTQLTLVNNTGNNPIAGAFNNLTQGQTIQLDYNGISYPFIVHHFGNDGNDLVLLWANTRLIGWGYNPSGQVGDDSTTDRMIPVAIDRKGALAGKTILALAGSDDSSYSRGVTLALCTDGTLAAWGYGGNGQLGNNTTSNSRIPVAVNLSALAKKTVIAVAAGQSHNLALCSDGTVATWGNNTYGQLGNGTSTTSSLPVVISQNGILKQKTITAIAAGSSHCIALCSDGTLATWGNNANGQLGDGTNTTRYLPVAVDATTALAGKSIIAIAAGFNHNLALCADNTLVAWGGNVSGQLGDDSTTDRNRPVAVSRTGALAGKTITAIDAGGSHSLALCADGTLAVWGSNYNGQLSTNTSGSSTPVAANTSSGVLAGKTIAQLAAGDSHTIVRTTDGRATASGNSYSGRLGTGGNLAYYNNTPALVNTALLAQGERLASITAGANSAHALALVASPPPPLASTLAATAVGDRSASLNGEINPNGAITTVTIEYGPTPAYGQTLQAGTHNATGNTQVTLTANNLLPGTTYHFRVVATNVYGTSTGSNQTFTTTDKATLAALAISEGSLTPAFSPTTFSYSAMVSGDTTSITLTPTPTHPDATLLLNGSPTTPGAPSAPVALARGSNTLTLTTTSGDTADILTTTLNITRLPETFAFDSPATIPLTAPHVSLAGNASVQLEFAPTPGTRLTLIDNTGNAPIQGSFDNLAHGQLLTLLHNGILYRFVVNYYGNSGNDLVLQWANTRLHAWGGGASGALGIGSPIDSAVPVPVRLDPLGGRTILAATAGGDRRLVLCADGTLFQWGANTLGSLSNYTSQNSLVPVPVNRPSFMAGQLVTTIAAGDSHFLVLTADGTLAAWGSNTAGQLGNSSAAYYGESSPVPVNRSGVLAGKSITAIATGGSHNLVLCADGSLVAWGNNSNQQLGNSSITQTNIPGFVNQSGALTGKTVIAIAAGGSHNLALCSDGSLAAWGSNSNGQLGNGTTTTSGTPVAVNQTGVLAGKTITAIAAGAYHSLALCSDGTLAAWGYNDYGSLGNNSTTNANTPVAVVRTGVLAGKTITAIAAGMNTSHALCSDGSLASWGHNGSGQLGNGTTTQSTVPIMVNTSPLASGERFISAHPASSGTLAVTALPPAPIASTLTATHLTDTSAQLRGSVNPQGSITSIQFEYGTTTAYGQTLNAFPAAANGANDTPVSVDATDLDPATTYHFRVTATSSGGTAHGENQSFTTSALSRLANLTIAGATLTPPFSPNTRSYLVTVPADTPSAILTATAEIPTTTIEIDGQPVDSASPTLPIALAHGPNPIQISSSAADGTNKMEYVVTVTRLPASFDFTSTSTIPLTVNQLSVAGLTFKASLGFAPDPGTDLTAIQNTSTQPILGRFANLAHGQAVALDLNGTSHVFVADYFGGTGNDLVLRWGNVRPFAWGPNHYGQVGDGSTTDRAAPVPVSTSDILANRTVHLLARGPDHAVTVCPDGTLAAWGYNVYGQLGLGQFDSTNRTSPAAVNRDGVLANRQVSAVAIGASHTLALCTDGTLASWGYNNSGQLGIGTTYQSYAPVAVDRNGALANKTITHIATGSSHSLALCSDGSLAAWGANGSGQLGNGQTASSSLPVLTNRIGALAGKTIAAVAAGASHTLALCSDGTLVAWGSNSVGQLGNGTNTTSGTPVAVNQTGVLTGKTITAIAAGNNHNLVLCSDGTLATWGHNANGQLGNGNTTHSNVPVLVNRSGVLAGKKVSAIAVLNDHCNVLCTDGSLAVWGSNATNGTTTSSIPVLVPTTNLPAGARFSRLANGGLLALVAEPSKPLTPAIADTSSVVGTSQSLAWSPVPLASSFRVFFGTNREAVANANTDSQEYLGETPTASWPTPQSLAPDTLYYWRVDTLYPIGSQAGQIWSFRVAPIMMPTTVTHTLIKGMNAETLQVPIASLMPDEQPWTATATQLPAWLTLPTSAGTTPTTLELRIIPGALPTGTQQTTLTLTSGNATFILTVKFNLIPLDLTKFIAHPSRQVVYGINKSNTVEPFARVVEIDAPTGTMRRTLPAGAGPTDADLDPTSERLFIANSVNWVHTGTTVIDLSAWAVTNTLPLGTEDNRIEATPTNRLVTEGSNQWVSAFLWNATTGERLATLGGVRAGDCETDPSGRYLYHCDANSSGARILQYDLSNDAFTLVKQSPVVAYGSYNLVLSPDGSRLFWQGLGFDAASLDPIAKYPAEVHATNSTGEIAIGASAIWWADSGTTAATLPFATTIAAISAGDSHLLRFDTTNKAIVVTRLADLTEVPGPQPRPGQVLSASPQRIAWSPVPGATSYRLFLADQATPLQLLTDPTAITSNPWYDLPEALEPGANYHWRVDAVTAVGTTQGSLLTFAVRFTDGPEIASIASPGSTSTTTGLVISLNHGRLAIGNSAVTRFLDFDPVNGTTTNPYDLTALSGYSRSLLDGPSAAFAIPSHDTTQTDVGTVRIFRPDPLGYWLASENLMLPSPAGYDQLGTGLALSGNLLLAGTGDNSGSSRPGRVGFWITEPSATPIQTLTPADSVNGDAFGHTIAIQGNHAVIASPGRGSSYNRLGCLYAFNRSTTTGLWSQSQKITIPGATTSGGSGKVLAMAGSILATRNDAANVVIYTRDNAGLWQHATTINRTSVTGYSADFATQLAIAGDLLFIGDPSATVGNYGGGAVFVFKGSGSTWRQLPTITPTRKSVLDTFSNFGRSLSTQNGWLAVCGTARREAWLFKTDPYANAEPSLLPGIPTQALIGRTLNATLRTTDPDGTEGLAIELVQAPAWLTLTNQGDGTATLSGTPDGKPGDTHQIQLRILDGEAIPVHHTLILTLVAATDLPQVAALPAENTCLAGASLLLSANTTGTGPFQWQWHFNGEPIPGATHATLSIPETSAADAGNYHVTASNIAGSTPSNVFSLTVVPATLNGGNWPTFGGSNSHNGRHTAALENHTFTPAWSQPLPADGRALHRAAIADGRVVVIPTGTRDAPSDVTALDLTTGKEQWKTQIAASYSYSPPTIANDRVYLQRVNNSSGNQLICLDAATGTQKWASAFSAQWDFYEAPTADASGIYINGGTYGGMYAFNPDGSQRFFLSMAQFDGWTPTLHQGRLFTFVNGTFTEHNPADAAALWSIPALNGTNVVAALANTAVVLASNKLTCIDLDRRNVRWQATAPLPSAPTFSGRPAIGHGHAYAINDTTVRSFLLADGSPGTTFAATEPLIGQPIILNDHLIAASSTTTWVFDLTDGSILQTLPAGGTLSYADGHLLAAGSDGTLRAFVATQRPQLTVDLDGSALDPAAATASFGAPLVGQASTRTLTLRNGGTADLTGITLSFDGKDAAAFTLDPAPPATLTPGASSSHTLTFTPATPGPHTATFTLNSNDPAANPLVLTLTGSGNRPPTFSGYTATTRINQALSLSAAKITARATDPDGHPVDLAHTAATSSHGGTASLTNGSLTYTPPANFTGSDSLELTLTDLHGASTTGTLTLTIAPEPTGASALGRNLTDFSLQNGRAEMTFRGIPGRSYVIQRSNDLLEWQDLGTITAGSDGRIRFTDPSPPPFQGFYRTKSN